MTTVRQLIESLEKWHDGDAAILYQYITAENGVMNNAEFTQVSEWLEQNEEFADAMSETMNEWIARARAACVDQSPCCSAPLFHEICEDCNDMEMAVPVCEICGQVDARQDLKRCTTHERICFGCDYLKLITDETMLDDGTVAGICKECSDRVNGGQNV
jgi:hypothetical protein